MGMSSALPTALAYDAKSRSLALVRLRPSATSGATSAVVAISMDAESLEPSFRDSTPSATALSRVLQLR